MVIYGRAYFSGLAPPASPSRDKLNLATLTPKPQAAVLSSPEQGISTAPQLPHSPGRLSVWIALAACLGLACVPLLIGLNRFAVTDAREAKTLAVAIQTLDHHAQTSTQSGPAADPFVPYLNGHQQLADPPGTTWVLITLFELFGSETTSTNDLIQIGKSTSVAMALITIAAVFWIGLSLDGLYTAVYAAVICATNAMFVIQGRTITTEIYFLGWGTLSLAAALWATRPLRPMPSVTRQAIGWVVCGVTLAAAVLTLGPEGLVLTVLPIGLILVLCPHRLGHMLGLLAAALIGSLTVLPWVIYVHVQVPTVWGLWLERLIPIWRDNWSGEGLSPSGVLLVAMAITAPWMHWLCPAIMMPLSPSSRGERLRATLGLTWFITVSVMLTLWTRPTDLHKAMLIVPAYSIVIAQLLSRFSLLIAQGLAPLSWRIFSWIHWAIMGSISLGTPILIYKFPSLIDDVWFTKRLAQLPPWWMVLVYGIVLTTLAAMSIRWMLKQDPKKSAMAWLIWAWAGISGLVAIWTFTPRLEDPLPTRMEHMAVLAGGDPVYRLQSADGPSDPWQQHAALWLYLRRPVMDITMSQVQKVLEAHQVIHLIASPSTEKPSPAIEVLTTLPGSDLEWWRCDVQKLSR